MFSLTEKHIQIVDKLLPKYGSSKQIWNLLQETHKPDNDVVYTKLYYFEHYPKEFEELFL